jgi:hypothetical protein
MPKKTLRVILVVAVSLAGAGVCVAATAIEKPGVDPKPAVKADNPATVEKSEAAGETVLQVETAVVATGIENKEPQGVAQSFPANTQKLYCYSKITGGKEGDEIIHQWMKGEDVIASITLKVNGSPWRTHSFKTMPDHAVGKWSVKIMQKNKVLKVVPFEIEKE